MRRFAPLALPFVLAACGGAGSGGSTSTTTRTTTTSADATATVNAAITKGSKQAARADFSGVVRAAGEHVTMSGSGDVDPSSRRGTLHVTVGLAGQQIPFDEVLDGPTAYVSSDFFTSFLPSGKKWLKVPLSSASNLGAAGFALTSQPGAVPQLEDVRSLGGGEYRGRVDERKLSPAEKSVLKSTHAAFGNVDVWIGTDGYVHRVRVVTSSSAGGKKANIVLTTTMSHYGETVHVTVPPASETVNASNVGIPGFSA